MNTEVSPSSSVYNLVCKKCTNHMRFAKFDDFMQHSQEKHGTAVGLQDMAIVPENAKYESQNECQRHTADTESKSHAETPDHVYDMSKLPRKCLIEMSQLLGKCLCIWHKPTRRRVTRRDRFYAYQLLLRKLREYEPAAKFRDARVIVRQIIIAYLEEERGGGGNNCTKNDIDNDTDNPQQSMQLQAIKSRTVLEQLLYLSGANTSDTKELEIDKFCAFCNTGFYSTTAVFTHMVQHHLPLKPPPPPAPAATDPETASTTGTVLCERSTVATSTTRSMTAVRSVSRSSFQLNTLARSSVYSLRSKSRLSTTIYNSEYDTDFGSDQSECCCACSGKERRKSTPKRQRKRSTRRESNTSKRSRSKRPVKRRRAPHTARKASTERRHRGKANVEVGTNTYTTPVVANEIAAAGAAESHGCLKCTRSFKRLHYLSSHMLRMHPPTQCTRCNIAFPSADQLKQHLLQQHAPELVCPICNGASGHWHTPAHLAEHFYNHICTGCMATFHDAKKLRQHRLYCRLQERLWCGHCEERFPTIQALRKHSKDTHQEYEPFKCGMCERRYKFLAPLMRHENCHKRTA